MCTMLERVKLNNVRADRFRLEGTAGILMKLVPRDYTSIPVTVLLCATQSNAMPVYQIL